MEAVNTELSGLNRGQREKTLRTPEEKAWCENRQREEEENKARSRREKWELRRKTGGNADTHQAELPVEEWRMKEQRGETGPGRSDGALQRSMRRASIIQQL